MKGGNNWTVYTVTSKKLLTRFPHTQLLRKMESFGIKGKNAKNGLNHF